MNGLPGSPIARGATAEIYEWEPGTLLKLFHTDFHRSDVEYEAQVARAVHASGAPVPAVGEIVELEGRFGLVYERAGGISMLRAFAARPWRIFPLARRMAELHAVMHDISIQDGLPSQRDRQSWKISHARPLPEPGRAAALAALDRLPDGDRLCHGDFHPDNILMDGEKVTVIDWMDAFSGNPLADVARTSVILLGAAGSTPANRPAEKAAIQLFHAIYLRRYFTLRPGGMEIYRAFIPVIAAGRLSENIAVMEKWLLAEAQKLVPQG